MSGGKSLHPESVVIVSTLTASHLMAFRKLQSGLDVSPTDAIDQKRDPFQTISNDQFGGVFSISSIGNSLDQRMFFASKHTIQGVVALTSCSSTMSRAAAPFINDSLVD